MCEVQGVTSGPMCAGFKPGSEMYELLISPPVNDRIVAFRYSVTATSIATGEKKTASGLVDRANGLTVVILPFAGLSRDFDVTIENLEVSASRLSGMAGERIGR